MSQPITWRNVTGPSPSEASRPLEVAGNSFNNALGGLGQLMSQQQSLDKTNLANTENRMRQAYLNQLAGASSPDQLEQMKRSGALGVSFDSLDPASQALVRGAADARLTDLRQQVLGEQAYTASQAAQSEKPALDTFNQLLTNGAYGNARDFVMSSNILDKGTLLNNVNLAERAKLVQGREDAKYSQSQQLLPLELRLREAQLKETERTNAEAVQARELITGATAANEARLRTPDLKAAIKESMRTGKPVPDLGPGSDTDAADKYFQKLLDSKEYSPTVLEANRSAIRSSFATNGLSPLVGKDASARDRAAAENAVAYAESDKNNWYAPGSDNARRNYEELAKDLPNLIDKTSGRTPEEDIGPLQNLLGELSTKGLEVDGNYVSPSANDVRWALRSAKGSWFTDGSRADNVREILVARTKESIFKQMLRDGEASNKYRLNQEVKKKLLEGIPVVK